MLQDASRLQRVVSRITRGLYSLRTGRVLALDWPVACDLIDPEQAKPIAELIKLRFSGIGNGTFAYDWRHHPSDDREGLFWMMFYGLVHFWGYTGTALRPQFGISPPRDTRTED